MNRNIQAKKILFGLAAVLTGYLSLYIHLKSPEIFSALIIGILIFLSIQKKLHYGLYIVLFLPVLGELSRISILGQDRGFIASDLIIPAFILIWLFNKRVPLSFDLKSKRMMMAIIAFIMIAILSLLLSLFSLSFKEVIFSSLYLIRFVEYALLFPITIHLLSTNKNTATETPTEFNPDRNAFTVDKLIGTLTFSSLLIALGGFIQLTIYPDLEKLAEIGYDPHINRLVGSWLDPNFIGGFFAFMTCIFLGIALHTQKNKARFIFSVASFISVIALFLTYSRSAYLALFTGIIVIGLLKSRKTLIIISILAMLGLSVSDRAQQRVGELLTSITSIFFNTAENPDPTARLRLISWQQSLELIGKKPLVGHGYNTLRYVKLLEGQVNDEEIHSASGSDSSILTIAATTGVLGLIPFCLIYLFTMHTAFTVWRKNKIIAEESFQKTAGFALGLLAGTLSLIIHSVFVNSLLFPQILIFFWIATALLYFSSSISRKSIQKS